MYPDEVAGKTQPFTEHRGDGTGAGGVAGGSFRTAGGGVGSEMAALSPGQVWTASVPAGWEEGREGRPGSGGKG